MMRLIFINISLLILFSGCSAKTNNENIKIIKSTNNHKFIPHQFQSLWQAIKSDKYKTLPQYKLSYSKIKDKIEGDAIRTLEDRRDLIEPFNKLAHPNGICLKGTWQIDNSSNNMYSGYFAKKSTGLVIARASTAFDGTKYSDNRAFGMAIKLFATTNPNKTLTTDSANIFMIDDLGGNSDKYFSEVELTNEPPISFSFDLIKNILYNIKLTSAFSSADKNAGIRQLYEISELNTKQENTNINTPKWIKIKLQTKLLPKDDFRDELKITNQNMIFDIFVSSQNKNDWLKIGKITFDESVSSYSCDHRLHFHHPKYRELIE